jgi:hypothetical protein
MAMLLAECVHTGRAKSLTFGLIASPMLYQLSYRGQVGLRTWYISELILFFRYQYVFMILNNFSLRNIVNLRRVSNWKIKFGTVEKVTASA